MAEAETLASQMRASLSLHKRCKLNHDSDVTTGLRSSRSMSARKRTIVRETKKKSLRTGSRGATQAYVDGLLQEPAKRDQLRPPKPAYGRFIADEIDEYPAPEFYDPSGELVEYYTRTEWIRKREQGLIEKRKAEHLDEAGLHTEVQPRISKKRRFEERTHDPTGPTTTAQHTAQESQPKPEPCASNQTTTANTEPRTKILTRKRAAEDIPKDEDDTQCVGRKKHKTSQGGPFRPSPRNSRSTQSTPSVPSTSPSNDAQPRAQPVAGDGVDGYAESEGASKANKPTDTPESTEVRAHLHEAPPSRDVRGKQNKRKLSGSDELDAQCDTGRRKILKTSKKWKGIAVEKKEA